MSTRLTEARRTMADRFNAWIEARATDHMLAYAQRTEDALTNERHRARGLEQDKKAMRAANQSMELEIATENLLVLHLANRLGLSHEYVCRLGVESAPLGLLELARRNDSYAIHPAKGGAA